MRQLLYVSAASASFREPDLKTILNCSRRNNPAYGITGMLLYMDRGFIQILEGPAAGVGAIFTPIQKDTRHKNLRVLVDRRVDTRLFAGWSMGFDRLDGNESGKEDAFVVTPQVIRNALLHEKSTDVVTLLSTFYLVNSPNGTA
jgi:hypothetical protein